MKELRKVWAVSKVSLLHFFSGPRVISLLLLTTVCLYYVTSGISSYAAASEYALSPWLFPFLLTIRNNRLIFFSIAMLMFCDVGKKERVYPYQIVRTGTMVYMAGRVIYIMIIALFYVLFLAAMPILINISQISFFNDWGKVLGAYSSQVDFLENGMVGSPNIIHFLSVKDGMIASILLTWGSLSLIGLVIYLVELLTHNNNLAVLTAGIIVIIDYIGYTIGSVDFNMFRWIYPLSWCDLSRLRLNQYLHGPTMSYAIVATVVVLTGILLAIVIGTWYQKGGRNRWKKL